MANNKWWDKKDGILTPKGKESRIGYVYFIEAVGSGYVKIGFATSLDKRLSSLQTSNPHKLQPLHSILANYSLERAIQAQFKDHHIRGEWYKLEPVREWIYAGSPMISVSAARRVVHASMLRAVFGDMTQYLSDYFDQHGVVAKKVPMAPSEYSGEMMYKHGAKAVHYPVKFTVIADEYLSGRGIDPRAIRTWNDLLLDAEMEADWELYHAKRAKYIAVTGLECYTLAIRDEYDEPRNLTPWEEYRWTEHEIDTRMVRSGIQIKGLSNLEQNQWRLAALRTGVTVDEWVRRLVRSNLDQVGWPPSPTIEEDESIPV